MVVVRSPIPTGLDTLERTLFDPAFHATLTPAQENIENDRVGILTGKLKEQQDTLAPFYEQCLAKASKTQFPVQK